MPSNQSKRRFTRLPVKLPVQLETEQGLVPATLLDLSRGGVRLRVHGRSLGVYRLAPLALVGRRVAEVLGAEFSAQFNPERLGSLLTRRMRPVRLGQRSSASADVELGCVLVPPLNDLEAGMLGLALPVIQGDGSEGDAVIPSEAPSVRGAAGTRFERPPQLEEPTPRPGMQVSVPLPPPPLRRTGGEPKADPKRPAPLPVPPVEAAVRAEPPAPAPTALAPGAARVRVRVQAADPGSQTREPRRASEHAAWRAYVHRNGSVQSEPILGTTSAVSPKGVEVRVLSLNGAPVDGSAGVAATATKLGDVLGSDVALRIMDGATHLWTGPARIELVEVGPMPPHPISLWLNFGRPLRPAELRTLGVA